MTTLYAPPAYTGEFATIAQLGASFRLTCWQFGRATGHGEFATLSEAVVAVIGLGLAVASEAVKAIFEQDVILAQ